MEKTAAAAIRNQTALTVSPRKTARTATAYAPAAATASQPITCRSLAAGLDPTVPCSALPDRIQPGDVAPEDEGVHVVRALVGTDRLEVQHVADDRILVHDPVGAEDVAREPRGLEGSRHVAALGERDLLGTHPARVLQP